MAMSDTMLVNSMLNVAKTANASKPSTKSDSKDFKDVLQKESQNIDKNDVSENTIKDNNQNNQQKTDGAKDTDNKDNTSDVENHKKTR